MTTDRIKGLGSTKVIVTLGKGETHSAMVSTKREYVGPGKVVYSEYEDGGITLHTNECTARLHSIA